MQKVVPFITFTILLIHSPGFEVLLANVYAQTANKHLILLSDAEIYGIQWEMTQQEINSVL
ncbi:insecticidal delta-endotoxin Cry8Ea1 family protein [Lysinibacillus sp. NPDC047702]|uniref:insecticidal delta-endotoxin Cry8Ea1 family protein n=1 Tax=unclassified Lysinibacillus TaxID=2636778 RepID=UPI003CFDAFDD